MSFKEKFINESGYIVKYKDKFGAKYQTKVFSNKKDALDKMYALGKLKTAFEIELCDSSGDVINESIEMSSLIYAAKKDKDKTIMVMTSNGKHFSITLDQILDSDGEESVFGCDEDGEEHEIFLKNISKIIK